MPGVTCRDCALPYETWPGVCPNCGSAEPAPEAPPADVVPAPEVPGDGAGVPLPDVDGEQERDTAGTGEPVEPVPAAPAPDYASWTVAELRDELDRRGLPASGVKAALVARLAGGGP